MAARETVLQSVIDAVRLVQDSSGRDAGELTEYTDLLSDVDGFDSLNALEVVVHVSEDLKLEVPEETLNPSNRTLTVGTLVDRIVALAEENVDVTN